MMGGLGPGGSPPLRLVHDASRLKSSDGGGTSDGMEERVKRLESDVSDVKKIVTDIRVTLAGMDERMKHIPTRWDVFLMVVAIVGLIGTVLKFLPND